MNLIEQIEKKSIQQYTKDHSLEGNVVLLRIDVNVTLNKEGQVDGGEDWRIIKAYPTIELLCNAGAKVVLISHIGRLPEETLLPVYKAMKDRLPSLVFTTSYDKDSLNEQISTMENGSVMMLENLRLHAGETEDNADFLLPLVELCDLYVNDAFSVSHRAHASVHAVTKLLPSYFGLQVVEEVQNLSQGLTATGTRTLVLGGAKFGTKLDLLEKLLPQLSYVLMGGALANVFLKDRGFEIGNSFVDDSVNIQNITHNEKIILPVDIVDQHGDLLSIDEVESEDTILDIGHETEDLFHHIINSSDVIIWNGPMGKYEDGYISGSQSISASIAGTDAFSVTGGGDTAAVILQNNAMDGFSFVSTGGGAMLDFLVQGSLPGLDVIIENQ
jgi:3-phosphoglycerate kinase